VLIVTTEPPRARKIQEAARRLSEGRGVGASLFLIATFGDLAASSPLAHLWQDGAGHASTLI
jgi:hypothetical protein